MFTSSAITKKVMLILLTKFLLKMKNRNLNLKGIVLGVILSLGVTSTFAGEEISIKPYLNTNLSVVSIINPSASNLNLKILGEEGTLYYMENIGKVTATQKLMDFSNLKDGTYKIVASGKESNLEKEFTVANNKLAIESSSICDDNTIFCAANNDLYVTYLSLEKKNVNISIANNSGDIIFENSYKSEPNLSKQFNVEALPSGEYRISLVSENKEYSYAFQK